MGFGSYPWSPFVLLTPKASNVAMEVTAGNFDVLFDIVQAQIAERDGGTSRAASPKRKMRRRKSDENAPKGSPNSRKEVLRGGEGWLAAVRKGM